MIKVMIPGFGPLEISCVVTDPTGTHSFKGGLSRCRQLMGLLPPPLKPPQCSTDEMMLALTGIDITRCPLCQKGTLVWLADLPLPARQDSS